MLNTTFNKIQGVLKMVVSIITTFFILLVIIIILTGNDERINLPLNDIPSIIGEIFGLIIGISLYFIFSVYLFLSGKLQFKSQKSKYRVLYFLSLPISLVILIWFIIMIIGIFKNPNSLTEIGALIFFFILLLIVYVIIADAIYQFSRKKYEVATINQVVVNPLVNSNSITPILEEQKIVNNNEIYPEEKKLINYKFLKLKKTLMLCYYNVIKKQIIRFQNLNKGISRSLITGSVLIPLLISILINYDKYSINWLALIIYFFITVIIYWIIVFVGLWIYDGFKIEKNTENDKF